MTNYLTVSDLYLLRDYRFTPGFSGESWFGVDKDGKQWQAYLVEGDSRLTFLMEEDRLSRYMTRETFEELFT